jgi:ADP-heptose:LPS heptosyltransferase
MSRPDTLAGSGRVLCIRLDNAGDVVLTGPAIRALRAHLPEARIDLLASAAGAAAAALLPELDDVLVARVAWQDAGGTLALDPAREQALIELIAARDYDTGVIFTSFAQTAWPAAFALYLAGVPVRAAHAERFGGSVLSHPIPYPDRALHEAERDLHLIESLGVTAHDRALAVEPGAGARVAADRLLAEVGAARDALLVSPGASCSARRWDPTRYGRSARLVAEEHGLRVVVTGSPKERDLAAAVASESGGVSLAGRTDLPTLAALVERAALVLTGNSLVMHLADALTRPLVVLYSGTDLRSHWGPRRTAHALLARDVPCAPCLLFECPIGQPCLDVTPAEVAAAARGLGLGQAMRPGSARMSGDAAAGARGRETSTRSAA